MSLLSTNIAKVNRLSLKGSRVEATPKQAERPVRPSRTKAEEALSNMIAKNSNIKTLVEVLDLIPERAEIVAPEAEKQPKITIDSLALEILNKENNYSKEEILALIDKKTNVGRERAEAGFNLMVKNEIIEESFNRYYLKGSTPF